MQQLAATVPSTSSAWSLLLPLVMSLLVGCAQADLSSDARHSGAEGLLPDGSSPDAGPSDGSPPHEGLPDGSSPDGSLPDGSLPDAAAPPPLLGASKLSTHLKLASDLNIKSDKVLLSAQVTLPTAATVLLVADGRYGPLGHNAANIYITVDGTKASSDSYIDWTQSTNMQQHCFNAIGVKSLAAGSHTINLVADYISGGGFYVGAGSNLSVMVNPATSVEQAILTSDTGAFDFTTANCGDGCPVPHTPMLSRQINVSSTSDPVILLASGRTYAATAYGDAMWGIYVDGSYPGNGAACWTVNDIWDGAETHAPMYAHAFINGIPAGTHTFSLDATEFPWGTTEESVVYKVGAGTRLVALRGGMVVKGSSPQSTALHDNTDYLPIGTSSGWSGVPPVGTSVLLAEASIDVPPNHSGVVMFIAKTRVQGDKTDAGGTVSLWIAVDGVKVSNDGIQQLASPCSSSQRTVTASYLAAGSSALLTGTHRSRCSAWRPAASCTCA